MQRRASAIARLICQSLDYGSCSSFKEYPLICHQLKCVFLRSAVEAVDSLEDEQDDDEISSSDIIKNVIELDSIVAIAASLFIQYCLVHES